MRKRFLKYSLAAAVTLALVACKNAPEKQGQQYKDGHLQHDLELVKRPNVKGKPVNGDDFVRQVANIRAYSPTLFNRYQTTYQWVEKWVQGGADLKKLPQFGLNSYQMEGKDGCGNVQFTGYYTPLLQARYSKQGEFQHPIYGLPSKGKKRRLPNRAAIYRGALSEKHVLAYSNSMLDNFMMGVQGSGYVDFNDGRSPQFFGYAGKNGHGYHSIGKVLIDRGEVTKEEMSMQAIQQWASRHSEDEVRQLLEQNPSFVFFQPQGNAPVRGASAVPLIAKASAAADRTVVPPGSTLLAEIPLLDKQGKFTGRYQMRLMIALDVGGAIKGHHFDIYQGIGDEAGEWAGFYNHYGRVWLLDASSHKVPLFTVYREH